MAEELIPTEREVRMWLLAAIKHASHMEYFLDHLRLGNNDPERPHDLVGNGNKFEWDVIRGFALQYRDPKVDFKQHIMPSLELHRQQYHHRMWNEPDTNNKNVPVIEATISDMLFGAVDANCSLLENRSYQGGTHDYGGLREIALKNPPHKTPWMLSLIPLMQRIEQPNLEIITDLNNLPNVGLPDQIYLQIQRRMCDTLEMLKTKGYDL